MIFTQMANIHEETNALNRKTCQKCLLMDSGHSTPSLINLAKLTQKYLIKNVLNIGFKPTTNFFLAKHGLSIH